MTLTKTPQFQSFHIEGVNHISPADAFEAINNGEAVIIDVRELAETHSNCIPHDNVLYHPMSVIMDRLVHLPMDKLLIVACNSGDRSVRVANLFVIKGFENVANLDGGLVRWKAEGFPFEATPVSSCGCGCSTPAPVEKPESQSGCGCDCSSGCC
jgi:rhodanese-related sulfurtransferase